MTVALGRAQRDVREAPRGDVPTHLRDAHYRSAATIGHGQGYAYPHDHPDAYVDQEYRPEAVAGNRYYEPSDRGHEAVVAERLKRLRGGNAGVGDDAEGVAPTEGDDRVIAAPAPHPHLRVGQTAPVMRILKGPTGRARRLLAVAAVGLVAASTLVAGPHRRGGHAGHGALERDGRRPSAQQ